MNAATPFYRDGRSYPTEHQLAEACDRLAELLAQGFGLNEASARMGVSGGTGAVLFARICDGLGTQAS